MGMNLTKEQLIQMKQNIEKLQNQLLTLDKEAYDNLQKRQLIKNEIEELTTILMTATTLDVNNNDFIGLGSIFQATIDFNGTIDNDIYVISDMNTKVTGLTPISKKSPFAKAVMGLTENDKFSYEVLNNKYNGIINIIYKGDAFESSKTIKKNK